MRNHVALVFFYFKKVFFEMSDEDCPKNDSKCKSDEAKCREVGIGFECIHEGKESESTDFGYDNDFSDDG